MEEKAFPVYKKINEKTIMTENEKASVINLSYDFQFKIRIDRAKRDYALWHRRLSYVRPGKLRRLHEITTHKKAIPTRFSSEEVCDVCAISKMQKRRNHQPTPYKLRPLDLISVDVCGALPEGLDGNRYFLEIIDNHTRKSDTIPLKKKSDVYDALRKWKKRAERIIKREF